MPVSNTYGRSASVAFPSPKGCRASRVVAFGCVLVVIGSYCICPSVFAQTSDPRTAEEPSKSWTVTTDWKIKDANPTRIVESHSQNENWTLDKQSIQIWVDGRFQFNEGIERETLQSDANAVRITTCRFGHDGDGRKTLLQVTEEEKNILPGGDSNIVRLSSRADLNGTLRPIRREIVETNNLGNGVEEANTTVSLPSIYGSLDPAIKMRELRKPGPNDTIESQITTLMLDGSGNWQVREIRQNTITQAPNDVGSKERVFALDSRGRLGEVSRRVSKESETGLGEKVSLVETYSVNVVGRTLDGNLHLVERETTAEHTSATGEQIIEKKLEVPHSEPGSGIRPYMLINEKVQPGPSGFQDTRTVRLRDLNGNFGVVEVDTTKSDKVLTIQLQQTPAEGPQ